MSEKPTNYLISTCFDFGGRGVSVTVGHDGISYWFDESEARRVIQSKKDVHVILAACGDAKSRDYISRVYDEHTIEVPVPEDGLRIIREELAPNYWADIFPDDCDERLDAILEPLFWEHVNQYLSPPCSRI